MVDQYAGGLRRRMSVISLLEYVGKDRKNAKMQTSETTIVTVLCKVNG